MEYTARVRVDEEGQFVILPDELVRELGLGQDTRVRLCKHGDVIVVTKLDASEKDVPSV